MRISRRSALALAGATSLAALLFACHQTWPGPTDLPPAVETHTVTLTATGADPRNLVVSAGDRILFINNDTRTHNMTSDPHPEHDACPEINQVGFLTPGERRETGNLVTVESCGFHDHDDPDFLNLRGKITIK